MKKIIHISDLHFGTEKPEIAEAVLKNISALQPDVVVVSGDLTQRARVSQYKAAQQYLKKIPFPQIVVPGNHDITLFDIFRRFINPLKRFKKFINPVVNPVYRDEEIAIMGINTARSLTWKEGRISVEQMAEMRKTFCPLPKEIFKILVTHHPFIPPPDDSGIKLVGRSKKALKVIAECEIELLLAGHLHHGYSGDVRTHYPLHKTSVLVVQAGTVFSRRIREMPNAYNFLEVSRREIRLRVRSWNGDQFIEEQVENFIKVNEDWQKG
ncbi:MAG: metallophosphoesterase family protein [Calditrichia bacterium]